MVVPDREPEKVAYFSERQRPLCWAWSYITYALEGQLHSPVLGYLFIGISVVEGTSSQLVGNPRIHMVYNVALIWKIYQ